MFHIHQPAAGPAASSVSRSADPLRSGAMPRVVEDVEARRFELWMAAELLSYATYSAQPNGVVLVPHVETKREHRGNGNAGLLMDGLLGLLRASGRRIVPICPFAADHVRLNEEHHDLLAS